MIRKLACILLAAATAPVSLLSVRTAKAYSLTFDTPDGYYYTELNETEDGESVFVPEEHGCFHCSWNGISHYYAEMGVRLREPKCVTEIQDLGVDYEALPEMNGKCRSGVHYRLQADSDAAQKISADADGCFFRSDFENGSDGWETTQKAVFRRDVRNYADGSSSLRVTKRDSEFSGAACSLRPFALSPGEQYCIQLAVMQDVQDIMEIGVWLGIPQYSGTLLGTVQARCGKWSVLRVPFELPRWICDASDNIRLTVRSVYGSGEFCMDAVSFWKGDSVQQIDCPDAVSAFVPYQMQHEPRTDDLPVRRHQNDAYWNDFGGAGLKDEFGKYFRVGVCADAVAVQDPDMQDFYRLHFNSMSCKTEMLPAAMLRMQADGTVTASAEAADPVLQFAEQNGIGFRGGPFLQGSEMPDGMFRGKLEDAAERLEQYIRDSFAQIRENYPSLDLYAVDVCRDVLPQDLTADDPTEWAKLSEADRNTLILTAFQTARQYAPEGCKLFLCESGGLEADRTDAIYRLANALMRAGDYIDGVSLSVTVTPDCMDDVDLRANDMLEKLSSLGLDIQFTDVQLCGKSEESLPADLLSALFGQMVTFSETVTSVTLYEPSLRENSSKEPENCLFDAENQPRETVRELLGRINGYVHPPEYLKDIALLYAEQDSFAEEDLLPGDADCSGIVDCYDAVLILRFAAEYTNAVITNQGIRNGDVNADGRTDAADARIILQWISDPLYWAEL